MKILILTGKFGLGHWSASLSLRQQLLQCFPRAQVEVEDLIAYALPETSDLVYKGFHWLVTRGSGLFNLYYKLTQDIRIELRPACEGLLLSRLNRLLEERCPDAVIATHPACAQLISRYKRLHRSALPLVTCVTDLTAHAEWINYGTDCYLVGTHFGYRYPGERGVQAYSPPAGGPGAPSAHHGRRAGPNAPDGPLL